MSNDLQFIDTPISELPVSNMFKETSVKMGFSTLRQATDLGWGKLFLMEGFCFTWFDELVILLKEKGLLNMLETD